MSDPISQDPVLRAFVAIAADGDAIPPRGMSSLHSALRRTADDLAMAGRPIERVVSHVKSMATKAGIRESHGQLVADAVLWAIAYYYGEDDVEVITAPDRYRRRQPHSIETLEPPGLEVFRAD